MRRRQRMEIGLLWALCALGGCDSNTPASDAGNIPPPSDVGAEVGRDVGGDVAADVAVDAGAAAEIEALLDDPSPLRASTMTRPGFDDAEVMGLTQRLPMARALGASPDAFGFLADPAEALPAVRAVLDGRPRQTQVTVSLLRPAGAAGDAPLAVALVASEGVLVPRRLEAVEAGDAFRMRTARPLAPEALRTVELDARLTPGDQDAFTLIAYSAPTAAVGLSLRVGAVTFPVTVSAEPATPEVFDVGDGTLATVAIARDPGGPCVVTRGFVIAHTHEGASGLVGEFRGVLHRGPELAGYVRGVFGRTARTGRDVLYLQATAVDGRPQWFGEIGGFTAGARHAGRLTGASGSGSFIARASAPSGAAQGGRGPSPFTLELHTECR